MLVGTLALLLGSVVYFLPHFTTGEYELGAAKPPLCVQASNTTIEDCASSSEGPSLSMYLYVFILSQAICGIGGSILYTVGHTYLDDNVSAKDAPLFIGIYLTFGTLGPGLGFIIGGIFLGSYVDFDEFDTPVGLTPLDPRWVGAWWLGGCLCSAGLLLSALFITWFPPLMPGSEKMLLEKKLQTYRGRGDTLGPRLPAQHTKPTRAELCASLKCLFTNPVFLAITAASTAEAFAVSSTGSFISKFVQNQFAISSGRASLLTGAFGVGGIVVGFIGGGCIARARNLPVRASLVFCTVTMAIATLFIPSLFLRCDTAPLAGVFEMYTAPNETRDTSLSLESGCNLGCGCSTQTYIPLCGEDGLQYFSPCHAGCARMNVQNLTFSQCSCIPGARTSLGGASLGRCELSCTTSLFLLLAAFFFFNMFMLATHPIALSSTFRCVPQSMKTMAVGIQWVFVRFLGSVLGPLAMGNVLDLTCVVWQETACDGRGSCWVYDSAKVALNFFLMAIVFKVVTVLCYLLSVLVYRGPSKEKEDSGNTKRTPVIPVES